MMKTITLVLLSFTQLLAQSGNQELTRKTVLNRGCTIMLPTSFSALSADLIELKYPNAGHRPAEVYSNVEGTINVALNHTQSKTKPSDLPAVRKAMEAQFNRAPFQFIKSDLRSINGSDFVVLEFVSQAVDTKIYNLMAMGSLEGRLVIITFNCTEPHRKQWEHIGKEIINSIALKK